MKNYLPRFLVSSVVLILIPLSTHAATSQIFNMATTTNWNIRFVGPADQIGGLTPAFGYYNILAQDYDGDGQVDLVIGARRWDANARQDSGSIFFINHSLFASSTGTGITIDLTDTNNYNLRIDGEFATDEGQRSPVLADLNNDGKPDLIFSNYRHNHATTDGGSVYILDNSKFATYTTTGNTLDLASSTNWNVRIDGRDHSEIVAVRTADVSGNDSPDLAIAEFSSGTSDATRREYLVYDNIFDPYLSSNGNVLRLASSTNYTVSYRDALKGGIAQGDTDAFQDMNNDGKPDLIIAANIANPNSGSAGVEGSLFIIDNSILNAYGVSTGNDVNFGSSTIAYTLRIDGPATGVSSFITIDGGAQAGDIDGDGLPEVLVDSFTSTQGRSNNGSIYMISGAKINSLYSGTGNNLTLTSSANWIARFDGAEPGARLGDNAPMRIGDMDNDGKPDLLFSAVAAAASTTYVGHTYEFFNSASSSLRTAFQTTGTIFDLASTTPAAWNIRYDGAANGDWLGAGGLQLVDMNGDGQKDILVSAWGASVHGSQSGAVYLIYYFPHTITLDDIFLEEGTAPFDVTGTVSAPDNATTIQEVQWGHDRSFGSDSGVFLETWHDCAAQDGTFDSNSEAFVCHHEALDIDANHASPHTVFFRSEDSKGIYTTTANYPVRTYTHDSPISGVSSSVANDTATIVWTTSSPGSSILDILSGPSGTSTTAEADTSPRVTSHTLTFPASARGTYTYQVRSRDAAGNTATSTSLDLVIAASVASSGGGSSFHGSTPPAVATSTESSSTLSSMPQVPAPAAETLQAQIVSLMAQVAALQAQLHGNPTPTLGSTAILFTRDLTLGSQGSDVKALQEFLNAKGYIVSTSGTGSPGHESTYFGMKTRAALAKFQAAYAIAPAIGYFGPLTRAAVNSFIKP